MKRTTFWAVLFVVAACGCGGEAPDRPEDCTQDEFFNDRTRRCTPCPAVQPPDCPDGCGYKIVEKDNGCPGAKCAPNCNLCGAGQYYSEEDGLCRSCPGRPDCQGLSCTGELRVVGSFRAPCPPAEAYACGKCTKPENGCATADDGSCVDRSQ